MPFSLILFFLLFFGIFISEVFVIGNSSQLSFFLTLSTPLFLFLSAKIEKKKIHIPIKETILYILFIIFSTISTFLAIDKEIAIPSLLIYITGYFFFIFCFNYQKEIEKKIKLLLTLISAFSILIFIFNYLLKFNLFLEPQSLFYSQTYYHNQIGNLLVLGLIPIIPNLFTLLLFVFILFSYSRTAYLASSFVIILQTLKNRANKRILLIGTLFIIICSIFFILTTENIFFTKNKEKFGGRDVYFSFALSSIKERPWFGIGSGNFLYAALKRQINYGESTSTSHNFILDILSENGVLAGIFFMLFVSSIILRSKKNDNFIMFLALSLIFMTDYSYRFNTFLILWFILAGLIAEGKDRLEGKIIFPALGIFIGLQVILFAQIFLNQGLWRQSLYIYPFQKKAYESAIEESISQGNKQQAYNYLQKYDKLFGQLIFLKEKKYYQDLNNKEMAMKIYSKALLLNPFIFTYMQNDLLKFYQSYYGWEKGKEHLSSFLKKIIFKFNLADQSNDLFNSINEFCEKNNINLVK